MMRTALIVLLASVVGLACATTTEPEVAEAVQAAEPLSQPQPEPEPEPKKDRHRRQGSRAPLVSTHLNLHFHHPPSLTDSAADPINAETAERIG